jgi:hypothetical protein
VSLPRLTRDLVLLPRQVESTVPESISLGLFNVGCSKVSRTLVAKHAKLAELLIELMARKTIENANFLVDKYKQIQHRLNKLPVTIEELTELREYCGTIPVQLGDLKASLMQTLGNFGVLDSVQYKLDRGAFQLKWEVFAWPKDILEKVGATLTMPDYELEFVSSGLGRKAVTEPWWCGLCLTRAGDRGGRGAGASEAGVPDEHGGGAGGLRREAQEPQIRECTNGMDHTP